MKVTIHDVCQKYRRKLFRDHDFVGAAVVRNARRHFDPKSKIQLTPKQAKTTRAFLRILVTKS